MEREAFSGASARRSPERLALPLRSESMRKTLLLASFVAVAAISVSADSLSAERLARIDRLFQQYVDEQRIGGAVVLVLQDGKPAYERAFGWRDKAAGRRMTTDTLFRIAS